MGKTAFSGPILGSSDSMGGALIGGPIDLFARTQWVTYFNDFINAPADYDVNNDWSPTTFTAGTQTISKLYDDTAVGILTLDGGAGANQGVVTQLDGSGAAGRAVIGYDPNAATAGTDVASEVVFASRFRIKDVDKQSVFVGLAELHATSNVLLTNTGTVTVSDNHIGFTQILTDDGAIRFSTAGTAIANLVSGTTAPLQTALLDDGWIEVAIRCTGTTGYAGYVRIPGQKTNWTEVFSGTGTAWNEQMVISLGNMGAAAGDDLDVDYVMLSVKRDIAE
jgi:hypothetical protein